MKKNKSGSWGAYIGWAAFANLLLHGLTGKMKTGRDVAKVLAGGAAAGAGLCGIVKIIEKMSDDDESEIRPPQNIDTEVTRIGVDTQVKYWGDKAILHYGYTYTFSVKEFSNGLPHDFSNIKWEYSYVDEEGNRIVNLISNKTWHGKSVTVKIDNKAICGKTVKIVAYINSKQPSAQLEAVVSYGLVYKGCKKWGELQQSVSRNMTPNELIKVDNLDDFGKQRLEQLYYSGENWCKDLYENTPFFGTRRVLSSKDNLANIVIDNFYTGKYSKLTFGITHHLSKELTTNPTFQTYWHDYLSVMAKLIREKPNCAEINIISNKAFQNMFNGRWIPDFSTKSEIYSYDYYGLIGGAQQIEVEWEIFRMNTYNYLVNTKMFIRDMYCTDSKDINGIGNIKASSQSLPAFYVLQNCFGCHPFITEIIYQHSDIINIANL